MQNCPKMKIERQVAVDSPRNFKVLHQMLYISSIDFDSQTLFGYTELAVLPLATSMRNIRLNCSKQCRINRITVQETIDASFLHENPFAEFRKNLDEIDELSRSVDLIKENMSKLASKMDADKANGELLIKFPPEIWKIVDEQKLIRIGVDFNLEKPTAGLQFVSYPQSDETSSRDRAWHLFTWKRNDYESRLWFPCVDAPSELCTWKIEISCDAALTAICSGELQEVVYTSDLRRKTFYYTLSVPTSACNIGLSVGPYDIYVHPEMNELSAFCLPQLLPLLKNTCRSLHKVFEFFEELLSSRYPYGSFKLVFVDESPLDICTYSSLAVMHVRLLHFKKIIDQAPITRLLIAYSVARQFFGCYVAPLKFVDSWVSQGLSEYIGALYMQRFFGNNEYMHHLYNTVKDVIEYESKWDGVVLHPTLTDEPEISRRFPFNPVCPLTCSQWYREIYRKKSFLVIRILEKKLGKELLLQVMNKLLSVANHAAQQRLQPASWWNILLSTDSFLKCVSNVTGQDLLTFVDQWVRRGGHSEFVVNMSFNRKRNMIELEIRQDLSAKGAMKYVGPVTVTVQELDGSFNHILQIDDASSRHDIQCHSKARRQRKRKIPLWTGEEVDMDLNNLDPDSPLLWFRFDPELLTLSRITLNQPDYQWQYQLKHERDVVAQLQALAMLPKYPSPQTRLTVTETIKNEQCFYRVRCLACFTLTEVANKLSGTWSGPPVLFNLFSGLFGSKSCPQIPRLNNFSNFQHYFLAKSIVASMARLRTPHLMYYEEVHQFLLDLLKYNNNTQNKFSDDYYRANILESLGKTATAPNNAPGSIFTSGMFDQKMDAIVDQMKQSVSELTHALNLEKFRPSYGRTVTVGSLKALIEIEKAGFLNPSFYVNRLGAGSRRSTIDPSNLNLWFSFMNNDSFLPVRQTAAECLVDFLVDKWHSCEQVNFDRLMDVVTTGTETALRQIIIDRMLRRIYANRTDDRTGTNFAETSLKTAKVFDRLWQCLKNIEYPDVTVSCTLTDVCFALFDRQPPTFSAPIADNEHDRFHPRSSSTVAPIASSHGASGDHGVYASLDRSVIDLDDSFMETV